MDNALVNPGLSSADYRVRHSRWRPHLSYAIDMLAVVLLCGFGYAYLIPWQGYIFPIAGLLIVAIHLLLGGMYTPISRAARQLGGMYLIYFLLALVSLAAFAIDLREGLALLATTMIAFIVGCYLAWHFAALPPARLLRVLVANGWVAAVLMFGYLMQYSIALRATGDAVVDANINILAIYLVLGLGAALFGWAYMQERRRGENWKIWLHLGVFLPAIAITYSRGALAFAIIMVAVFVARMLRYTRFLRLMLLVGILAAIWLMFDADLEQWIALAEWTSSFSGRVSSHSEHGELRTLAYAFGWQQFGDHPAFGVGYSNFMYLFGRFGGEAVRAHNDLVEVFVEMGIVGGFLFVLILASSARKWWRLGKYDAYRPMAFLFFVVVGYMLIRPMQTMVIWYLFLLFPLMVRSKRP